MANDSKYIRLYPERAVAKARGALEDISRGIEVDSERADAALEALDSLGFPPDEPLFLLRGQDVIAPDIVRAYANERIKRESEPWDGEGAPRQGDEEVHRHLYEHADRMAAWQPRKRPD